MNNRNFTIIIRVLKECNAYNLFAKHYHLYKPLGNVSLFAFIIDCLKLSGAIDKNINYWNSTDGFYYETEDDFTIRLIGNLASYVFSLR